MREGRREGRREGGSKMRIESYEYLKSWPPHTHQYGLLFSSHIASKGSNMT